VRTPGFNTTGNNDELDLCGYLLRCVMQLTLACLAKARIVSIPVICRSVDPGAFRISSTPRIMEPIHGEIKFTLRGHHIEVDYTIGANPAFPALEPNKTGILFQELHTEARSHTDSTRSRLSRVGFRGFRGSIDAGGTTFAFFLPEIEVPGEADGWLYHRCHTGGIQWTETPFPAPPRLTWQDVSDGGHGPKTWIVPL